MFTPVTFCIYLLCWLVLAQLWRMWFTRAISQVNAMMPVVTIEWQSHRVWTFSAQGAKFARQRYRRVVYT